jgi:hypothetical protein
MFREKHEPMNETSKHSPKEHGIALRKKSPK